MSGKRWQIEVDYYPDATVRLQLWDQQGDSDYNFVILPDGSAFESNYAEAVNGANADDERLTAVNLARRLYQLHYPQKEST